MGKIHLIILILLKTGSAQNSCLQPADTQNRVIPFRDSNGSPRLPSGTQAIITSYQFQCCGNVTAWQTYVQPGGSNHQFTYYINFQVWRPSPTVTDDGCYSLVGENRYTSIGLDGGADSPRGLVSETPRPTNIISVQPGDVVGYFTFSNTPGDNEGIQLDRDYSDESVWYRPGNPGDDDHRNDGIDLEQPCPFPVGSAGELRSSTNAAPVFSVGIATFSCPTTSVLPTSSMVFSAAPTSLPLPLPPSSIVMAPLPTTSVSPSTVPLQTPTLTSLPTPIPSSSVITQEALTTAEQEIEDTTSVSDTTSTDGGLIGGLVVFVILLILLITLAIFVILIVRRHREKTGQDATVLNPTYFHTSMKKKYHLSPKPSKSINTSEATDQLFDSPEYQYIESPASASHSPATKNTNDYLKQNGSKKTTYIPPPGFPPSGMKNAGSSISSKEYEDPNYAEVQDLGSGQEDEVYTELYECPSTEQHKDNEDATFGNAGMIVPSQDKRKGNDLKQSKENYSKLKFFHDDEIYWTPASTLPQIYDQLSVKNYREIPKKQIQVLEYLGSGEFGTVHKGLWTVANVSLTLAIKQLSSDASGEDRIKLLQEAAIIGQFSHPNVVKLYGLITMKKPLMMCMEYMENGDLRNFISTLDSDKVAVRGTAKDMRFFFVKVARDIAAGMKYLHKKSFIHRDLAARNILVNKAMTCKIGDFGMARDLMDDTYYTSQGKKRKIPVKWTAPEALLYKKYSPDSDVWSYGMVLFEMWSLAKKPFSNMSNQEVIRAAQAKSLSQPPPPGCPRVFYKLMVDCWNPDHKHRPKFSGICNYLQQPVSKLLYWSSLDDILSPSVNVLGAPLEEGHKLYPDLQNKYKKMTLPSLTASKKATSQ